MLAVVGQKDLHNFREELGKKMNDTYSVCVQLVMAWRFMACIASPRQPCTTNPGAWHVAMAYRAKSRPKTMPLGLN